MLGIEVALFWKSHCESVQNVRVFYVVWDSIKVTFYVKEDNLMKHFFEHYFNSVYQFS